jgi:4-hydroxyacetophenone monooxygenase
MHVGVSGAAASQDRIDWRLLDAGIEQANIPSLLMVLVQMTGDLSWLAPRYAPRRARGLDDNDDGGLDPQLQEEIRAAAKRAIAEWRAGSPMAMPRPDDGFLAHMLGVAMAEAIPPGYGEIIASDLGLVDEQPHVVAPPGFRAIIVGAGVSGISAAVNLRRMGIECRIFEKNEDVGGTWWENHYPGAGVDTPNLTYTFSFSKNDWSRNFPLQGEILSYFQDTADRFGLREMISFGTKVQQAVWNEGARQWEVDVLGSDDVLVREVADIVISAVGVLNIPLIPEIPGADSFPGRIVHTARWPHDLELAGKRVAVIGNGASAMQVVPAIAPSVEHMTIFARSKQWAAPFPQFGREIPDGVRYLMQQVPLYRDWYQQRLTWTFNDRIHASLFKDESWPEPDRSLNPVNDAHRRAFTRYVVDELGDRQDLLEHVLPDFPPFAKRMLLDNGWYRTIIRDNVTLVPHHLAKIEGDTLTASNGDAADVDVIVLATGFRAAKFLASFKVIGREGVDLHEKWDTDDARAYLGTAIPGFPNFFMLLGPNVGSGHGGSMIRSIECQTHYVTKVLEALFERRAAAVEVREDVYEDYARRIDEAHERMVWTHTGVDNWYRNSRGRVTVITPWRNDDFWRMTRNADPGEYHFTEGMPESADAG